MGTMAELKEYGVLSGGAKLASETVKGSARGAVGMGARAGLTGGIVNFIPWAAAGAGLAVAIGVIGVIATGGILAPLLLAGVAGASVMGVGAVWSGVVGTGVGIFSGLIGGFAGAGAGLWNGAKAISKSRGLARENENLAVGAVERGRERAQAAFVAQHRADSVHSTPATQEKSAAVVSPAVTQEALQPQAEGAVPDIKAASQNFHAAASENASEMESRNRIQEIIARGGSQAAMSNVEKYQANKASASMQVGG